MPSIERRFAHFVANQRIVVSEVWKQFLSQVLPYTLEMPPHRQTVSRNARSPLPAALGAQSSVEWLPPNLETLLALALLRC